MIKIFTDGASKGNPGPGGYGAVIVLGDRVKEIGGGERSTTNNRMELLGAIKALEDVGENAEKIMLYSDSSYVINGITKWIFGWKKKDWITSQKETVVNRDLWERFDDAVSGKNIEWKYVGGHSGIAGNERVDEIASAFAEGEKVDLYDGPLEGYKIEINNLSANEIKAQDKSDKKSRSRAKAYSYISMIGGEIIIHQTWEECEKRVKGKSGAKFKKALSKEEEENIIKGWKSGL